MFFFGKFDGLPLGCLGSWTQFKGAVRISIICGEVPLLRLDDTLLAESLRARFWSCCTSSSGVGGGSSMLCDCRACSSCESRARNACVALPGVLLRVISPLFECSGLDGSIPPLVIGGIVDARLAAQLAMGARCFAVALRGPGSAPKEKA